MPFLHSDFLLMLLIGAGQPRQSILRQEEIFVCADIVREEG